VALSAITEDQIRTALADRALVLEARIAGRARDGGPMCGSVPILGDRWALRPAS
jgi:hypothetical protein